MVPNLNNSENNSNLGQFLTRVFNGYEISQREPDGFLNGTAMGKAGGKLVKDYNALKRAEKFKKELVKQGYDKVHLSSYFSWLTPNVWYMVHLTLDMVYQLFMYVSCRFRMLSA
jgi:hypothetical protein